MTSPENADRPDAAAMLLALLSLAMACLMLASWVRSRGGTDPLPAAQHAVDPNTAPWSELALLPRIGPSLAHQIVDYRSAAQDPAASQPAADRPFRTAHDLDRVRGIGPVMLHRLAPHLRFDEPPALPGGSRGSVRDP